MGSIQPNKGWKAKIKWLGYDENYNSWEPVQLMPRALAEKYRREHNLPEDIFSPAAAGVEVSGSSSSSKKSKEEDKKKSTKAEKGKNKGNQENADANKVRS